MCSFLSQKPEAQIFRSQMEQKLFLRYLPLLFKKEVLSLEGGEGVVDRESACVSMDMLPRTLLGASSVTQRTHLTSPNLYFPT